eukprot:TRINITY_DN7507_c1_g1_i1.p1 TRINITY_DN7507_c1_g1~~TRINITY_DN7507_c1_g1_i1.p1  ORF type:complete len:715 (-),score=167.12 TRINITY_DN7507_c1_g1_i1:128-2272(-)
MKKFPTRKRSNTSDSNSLEKPPSPSSFLKQTFPTQSHTQQSTLDHLENENKNSGDLSPPLQSQSPTKNNVNEKISSKDPIQSTEWARQLLEMIPRDADGQQIDKRGPQLTEQQPRIQDSTKSFIPGHYQLDVARVGSDGKYKYNTLENRRQRLVGENSRTLKFQVNTPNAGSPPDLSKTEANVLKWREIEEERKKRRDIEEEEKRMEFSRENRNNSNSSSQNISPTTTISHPLQNFDRVPSGGSLEFLENSEEENNVFLKRTGSAEIEYHRGNDSDVDFSGSDKEEDNAVPSSTPPQEKEEKGSVSIFNGGSGGKAKFMALMKRRSLKPISTLPGSGEKSEKDKKDRFLPTIGLDGRLKKFSTKVKGVLNQGPVFPSLPSKLRKEKLKTGDQKDVDDGTETPSGVPVADDGFLSTLILDEYNGSQQNERSGSPIQPHTALSDAREVTSSPSPTLRRRINRNINHQVAKQRRLARAQEINRLFASISALSEDIRQTKCLEDALQRKFDTFSFETSQNIHQFEEKVTSFKSEVVQFEKSSGLIDSQLKLIKPQMERASQQLNHTNEQIKSLETNVQIVQRSNSVAATDSLLRFFSRFSLSVFGVFEGTANLLGNVTRNWKVSAISNNNNGNNIDANNNDDPRIFPEGSSQPPPSPLEPEELQSESPYVKDPNVFDSDFFCDLLSGMSTEKCTIDEHDIFPENADFQDASQSFTSEN